MHQDHRESPQYSKMPGCKSARAVDNLSNWYYVPHQVQSTSLAESFLVFFSFPFINFALLLFPS